MLYIRDVQEYIKKMNLGYNEIFIGQLDPKLEKVMNIYPINTNTKPQISMGGVSHNAYEIQSIAILVHWDKKLENTQEAAYELFDKLKFKHNFKLSDRTTVEYLLPRDNEPKYIGKDENIYEFVMEFYVYYKNN